ncbi:MAG TPA: hypothetical protein VEI48_01755 [Candidatus Sulfotelmatobacter sp.]|nr:hypothetical protein [Candidatus Sulfotelmatobacter sp.]
MANKKKPTAPEGVGSKLKNDGDDVEGHSFLMHPSTGQELARFKNADLERQARQRQLAKEARPNKNSR